MFKKLKRIFNPYLLLSKSAIMCNSYIELHKLWKWHLEPELSFLPATDYEYPEDLNERRLHDAEVLMSICRNAVSSAALEIGTSTGLTTLGMAINAPSATIYTVDIPQDEAISGSGGKLITHIIDKETVGFLYKSSGIQNITQIFANTATWQPDLPELDLAFIDGCHDKAFVYNDTLKILPFIKPGGFIVWHDANPSLIANFSWIGEVCAAVEDLLAEEKLTGNLFCVRDSWMLIWRKPDSTQEIK